MLPDIASAAARARRDMVDRLREAGATGEDAAVALQPQQHQDRRALAYLTQRGVVRITADGRYWLSETEAEAWRKAMRNQNALIAGGLAAGLAALAFGLYRRSGGRD
jgi:hypothetical protein